MEQIFKVYGQFFLEAVVVVLLAQLIFTELSDGTGEQGIFNIVAARAHMEDIQYETYTDLQVYRKEAVKTAPEIIGTITRELRVGTNRISDFVKATDYAGRELPVKVMSIINPAGDEILSRYQADSMEILLDVPGMYTLLVATVDDGNRVSTANIRIPVNK